MSGLSSAKRVTRDTYRHGDLRRALLEAGVGLARSGGPEAVVLREATRQAGVVPNAAYRHFANRDDLLRAVRAHALSAVAHAMEMELGRTPADLSTAEAARYSLRAVGRGYLEFAQTEPGLFRTAFAVPVAVEHDSDPAKAGPSGLNPFQLLGAALDRMVQAGLLPSERRPNAEYLAWSAVHGLALLILDGPLHTAEPALKSDLSARLLEVVEKGL